MAVYNRNHHYFFVYCIQNTITKNIKIGLSFSVDERLKALRTGNDCPLECLYSFRFTNRTGAEEAEYFLHKHYFKYRVMPDVFRHEWFTNECLLTFPKEKNELLKMIKENEA